MPNETEQPKKTRILVVEDEGVVAMDLKRRLEKQGLCVVGIADSCDDALKLLQETMPDVVLMDIIIQGSKDGIATALEMRALHDIPVVFLTANSDPNTIRRAKETLPYGYLIKPFEERELVATIEMAVYRHQVEAQQRLYGRAITSSSSAIIVADARSQDTPIIFCNPAFERMTGYLSAEVLGRNCRFLQGQGSDPQTVSLIREAIEKGAGCNVTLLNYRKDGTPFWNELLISPVRNAAGQLTHFVSVANDVTLQRQSKEHIKELTALLDKAQDAIMVSDAEDNILYWNTGAERMYGWTSEEVIGKNAVKILFKEEPIERKEARRIVTERGEWAGELRQQNKSGKLVLVESRWTLLDDDMGKPKAKLVINTDITERRELEIKLLRMQRMDSIGTLASGVAHDLNNVLNPIIMGLELLGLRLNDEKSQQIIATLQSSAKHGADIVRKILSFTHGGEGERVTVSVHHLICEQERICRDIFYRTIQIRTKLRDDLWGVVGDTTQLHQVLMNLCVNARDAMPNGGTLTIEATNLMLEDTHLQLQPGIKSGPFVLITVSDTGMGISEDVMDKIFDPFFTTKEVGKGTGLGLSTVLGIVRGHHGFVDAYSQIGAGAQFRIYLPAAPLSQPTKATGTASHMPSGNGECILLVDDEKTLCDIAQSTLEAYGYSVLTASDGTEAVGIMAQRNDVAAVITDMSMPFMDGPATIRALQRMQPNIKIIAMSGNLEKAKSADPSITAQIDFLQKPFTVEKLLGKLNEVLEGTSMSATLSS